MKSKVFLLLTANLLLASKTEACGPFFPTIPKPTYFVLDRSQDRADFDRAENLRLWQSQTSEKIPLSDIEQVVYRDSREKFDEMSNRWDPQPTENLMYTFLVNSNSEAIEFLLLAKGLEEARRNCASRSPWYYPNGTEAHTENMDFNRYILWATNYDGQIFKERYAMQACRAMFAAQQYERCIEYYDSVFANVPNSSLMKRMAGNYAGGSWTRIGAPEKGDPLFAQSGDIFSLSIDNKIEFMLDHNPGAPQIMDYMRRFVACDSSEMAKAIPLAKKALKIKAVPNKGDWYFFLAYFYKHFANKPQTASQYIQQALNHKFSSEELKDDAIAYMMEIDGNAGNPQTLLKNLKWFEEKAEPIKQNSWGWNVRLCNLILEDWIPQLWKRSDYSTAILLANYAEFLDREDHYREEQLREGELDRGGLAFELMQSLTSHQLEAVRHEMMSSSPLKDYLRRPNLQSADLFNELIGTLALREGNYRRAIDYLTQVGIDYQRSMRIFRGGYLGHDPFKYYPDRWETEKYEEWTWYSERSMARTPKTSPNNAKLNFACQMLEYQQQMASAPTADERAWARFMFALGRRNSFEQCWALTQYWRGLIEWRFIARDDYYEVSDASNHYPFVYEYDYSISRKTERTFQREIEAAMKQMRNDETRARAEYYLRNYKTIAKRYPNTQLAETLKTSCDNWKNWL